jgi:hypothetical protein
MGQHQLWHPRHRGEHTPDCTASRCVRAIPATGILADTVSVDLSHSISIRDRVTYALTHADAVSVEFPDTLSIGRCARGREHRVVGRLDLPARY